MYNSDIIKDEQEAYWLGFLYADGFITNKYKDYYTLVGITLSKKDKSHLEKIAAIFNKKLKDSSVKLNKKIYEVTKFYIGDVNLVKRLIKLGLTPQKTYENNSFIFDNIPDNLKHHFIRGLFDGDGWIFNDKKNRINFGIVSLNFKLLSNIKIFLKARINEDIPLYKDSKYFRLRTGGNIIAKKFFDFLYKDSSIFLERKRKIVDSIPKSCKIYKYIGVSLHKSKRWIAQITNGSNKEWLGFFNLEIEAAKAYNKRALELNKKKLNQI